MLYLNVILLYRTKAIVALPATQSIVEVLSLGQHKVMNFRYVIAWLIARSQGNQTLIKRSNKRHWISAQFSIQGHLILSREISDQSEAKVENELIFQPGNIPNAHQPTILQSKTGDHVKTVCRE